MNKCNQETNIVMFIFVQRLVQSFTKIHLNEWYVVYKSSAILFMPHYVKCNTANDTDMCLLGEHVLVG